ncbi:MAG: dihydroorotate dehydrogenase (quinone) [Chloroflexi bacterium RBG_16_47_49]|nr:MAG: dihydroorotate dehydrogenase (quinone) [Chloroflexi bacterium RBG_16_47_49]
MTVYPLFRALLFKLDPERAHQLTLRLIHLAGDIKPVNGLLRRAFSVPGQPVRAFGLTFSNPVGLAAGYDKDGLGWRGLASLGFGHIEIGTVTPKPQAGNPKPRVFRLISDKALINRMGFPGLGEDFVKREITKTRTGNLVLGVNIGKNKDTPLESADQDYLQLLRAFAAYADYLTINISSPNTIGLRQLQASQALDHLLGLISVERERLQLSLTKKIPILVKLAPDLSDDQLDDALEVLLTQKMDGVIATNTTLSRDSITSLLASESGGLSGPPLFSRSLDMVGKIYQRTSGRLPVIGVGGIYNATGAQKMLDAGAVLLQIYTGLIYEGPGLVKRILQDLRK